MTKRHRLRALTIGAVTSGLLMLTACQGIPVSGGVHQGLPDLAQAEQEVQYRPDRPTPGAEPELIVRGFLQAASSASEDYSIAREYLTQEYQQQWDPSLAVTIDEGAREYQHGPDDTITLQLNGIASIDEKGVLTQLDSNETTQLQFEMREEAGEWRIASAPGGVILDRTTFLDVWSVYQLFFTGNNDTLVSDTRWFLNRATLGSHIVNQLLAGPSEGLTGVAVSSFPAGTRLATDAVIVDNGTALIDLSPEFESITEEALAQVDLQLASSLYSVPTVSSYTVTVDGIEALRGPVGLAQALVPPELEGDTRVGVVTDEGFGVLNASGTTIDPLMTTALSKLDAHSIVMSRDGAAAVAQSPDGLFWLVGANAFQFDDRENLLAPTTDARGFVWYMSRDTPAEITAWHAEHRNVTIATPELKGEEVVAMRVSPDSNRIAFLLNDDGSSRVLITGIVRDDNGAPVRLVDLAAPSVSWAQGAPLDLDWVDAQRVAVLSQGEADATRFTVTGPGLLSEARAGAPGAVTIRGGGRLQATYLLSANGDLTIPQGSSGWQRQAQHIETLVKRG